jgi:anaerobic magnesium-protoporphyrin IX monomethyl ester cyclase
VGQKMSNKKILFVIPKIYANYPGAMHPHVGVACLIAFLEKNGIKTEVVDMQLNHTFDYLLNKIEKFKPNYLGITMFSFDFINTYKLIDKIKRKTKIPLIIGGVHVSSTRTDVLENTQADYAVKQEGEYTLLELFKGKAKNKIDGLIWRQKDKIIENKDRAPIWNVDELPFPAYERFELKKYTYCSIDKRMPIVTSRGCPHACTYCAVKLSMGRTFRPRSAEHVVDEIEMWYKKGYTVFEIVDDCFSFDLNRAKRICELLVERNIKMKWTCGSGIRADRADEELLRKMKKAGCIYTAFGLESGDPEILKEIKKGITIERATETFKAAKKVGLKCSVNFMIGHQKETPERARRSLALARRLPISYANFHNYIPYPGTEAYEYVKKHGRFILPVETYLTESASKTSEPVFETPEFTYDERKKVLREAFNLTRLMHLRYRFGRLKGSALYIFARYDITYTLAKKFLLGTKLGRIIFNKLRAS